MTVRHSMFEKHRVFFTKRAKGEGMTHTETEVKFHISDLDKLAAQLEDLGAQLTSSRTHEHNLRFDTPAEDIRKDGCVLRLRRDIESRLTFKSPSTKEKGVLSREEIEFTVGDFDTARRFIEALGYQAIAVYEKYRTVYRLNNFYFMLDEMPYGNFLEIEGVDVESIQAMASQLKLDWDASVDMGYLGLFYYLCSDTELDITDLTFETLKGIKFDLAKLSIRAADC